LKKGISKLIAQQSKNDPQSSWDNRYEYFHTERCHPELVEGCQIDDNKKEAFMKASFLLKINVY
jgi:hypothetical protein